MAPRISIVMPVWNGEKYLAAAIESCWAQTFPDFELIVVDDGSTDGTPEILHSYRDERLMIHRLDHGGIVSALNFGIAQGRAEWIARQDADDVSMPDRIAQQWEAVQNNPKAALCFTDVSLLNESDEKVGRARLPRTRALIALRLCFQCPIVHSTVLFRKDTFAAAGRYNPTERHAEDYALWGRMLERGHFVALPDRLVQLRVHARSVSKQNLETQLALTLHIAAQHCARFMRLDVNDATRAAKILARVPGQATRRDWLWFLSRCAPRLRWWSGEAFAWLALQTARRNLDVGV
jgi:glycosyltransferase involved in cell wall biosynthesis